MAALPPPPATTRLTIDTVAIAANWRTFAAASGQAACGAAVKANGYGLGARQTAAAVIAAGCRDLFVAAWAEATALGPQPEGVRLAVLHGVLPGEMEIALASPAVPVLCTPAQVAAWRETGRPCDIMVDTGMNRLGLTPAEAVSGLLDGLTIDVLHSHLACAYEPEHPMNARQLIAFRDLAARIPARRRALANSGGVVLGNDYAFDLTRPGFGLYGGGLSPGDRPLAPVAAIEARIVQLRDLAPGQAVGYGATFTAARPTRLAIVALGYADGYPIALSNTGHAVIDGTICPVAGRVSMDLTAFDVTGVSGLAEGDWIDVGFDLAATAAATGRTEYELLTGLGHRYTRVYR